MYRVILRGCKVDLFEDFSSQSASPVHNQVLGITTLQTIYRDTMKVYKLCQLSRGGGGWFENSDIAEKVKEISEPNSDNH